MVDCSDLKCHDNVTKIDTCLKSKISGVKLYSILGGLLIAILLVISPFVQNGMNSLAENKKSIKNNEKNQAVTQEQIKTIKKDIQSIKVNLAKMAKQQVTEKQMKGIIKELKIIVKEASKNDNS